MIFAALDFFDYFIIAVLIALFAGGTKIASRRSASSVAAGERLRRIEEKLNLLLTYHGIDYVPGMKEQWQRLAESNQKVSAAKEYSDIHSVTVDEAAEVVDQYLADIREFS